MSRFSLIISIVPHDRGEKLTKAAVKAGCGGGSVLMGRALAKSNFGAVLGVGETTKDLIYTVVESEKKQKIIDAILESTQTERSNFGELFTLDVDSLMRAGNFDKGENMSGTNEKSRDMSTVIVNKG